MKDLITRRQFFSKSAQRVIPILVGLAMPTAIFSSCDKDDDVMGCNNSCMGTAQASCGGTRSQTCVGSSKNGCGTSSSIFAPA